MASVDEIMGQALQAAEEFTRLDQQQTDAVVRAAYRAGFNARGELARLAWEETNLGVLEHKVLKNVIATQLVYESIRHERTVGVVGTDRARGLMEIAQPVGPILALIPVNNPTSTALFKILICLKTRNPLIISPHQAAKNATSRAAEICAAAARAAGAPEHCIQCVPKAAPDKIRELMSHRQLALILATGTGSLVRAAYSSGTPTIGVGAGNVPVYIGASADVPYAVRNIIYSKTFDYGSICASEQAVVVRRVIADAVLAEFRRQRAWVLSPAEIEQVGRVAYDRVRGVMNAAVVGKAPRRIATMAGIDIPEDTSLLLAPLDGVGPEYPLSAEILAPILAFYVEDNFEDAIQRCSAITHYGGLGHTAAIYSNKLERIEYFSERVAVGRVLVNMPSTHGALGGMFNTLDPSFTLGCGSAANNGTTDNLTARHLLNIQRICRRRSNERWLTFDHARYQDESCTADTLEQEYNRNF